MLNREQIIEKRNEMTSPVEKPAMLKDVEFAENTIHCDKDLTFHKPCKYFPKCDIATHGKVKNIIPVLEMENLEMYCMTYEE